MVPDGARCNRAEIPIRRPSVPIRHPVRWAVGSHRMGCPMGILAEADDRSLSIWLVWPSGGPHTQRGRYSCRTAVGPRRLSIVVAGRLPHRQFSLQSPNWHHRSPPGTQVHRMCDSVGPDGSKWSASEAHRKPIKQPIRWSCSRDPTALRASFETHHARHLL